MNCLCCGKPLSGMRPAVPWHKGCIKSFFGTENLPEMDITESRLEQLAAETVSCGYTVPGVQKKLSLHLLSREKPRLTLVDYPVGYILKPQVPRFAALPEAEQLVMSMAGLCGIQTVPHALLPLETQLAYITKRVDRKIVKGSVMEMLAMEDFCQLDLRLTQDKYRGSYERCAKVIERYSSRPGIDLSELFIRLVFSFLSGNSDMHLKNFSLIEIAEGSLSYVLSPAYDLLPVNVVMPEDNEQFALTMNGKKRNLHRKDFLVFAERIGVPKHAAEKMIIKITGRLPGFQEMIGESLMPEEYRQRFQKLIVERADALA